MGVNNKEGMMKTSKIKTVRNIGRIRTLLVTLSVAVCLATLMGCGNSPEKNTSPAAEASPADDIETMRKAAEAGDAVAQYNLGLMYHDGEGVPEDYAEAFKWFRKAAEQRYAKAQYSLGDMYYKGRGVPQDIAEAMKWYRKAAEQGHALAQVTLGASYSVGRSVPKDDVAAYAWFSQEAGSHVPNARLYRDNVKQKLTPTQIEKGEAMAREISERIEKRKAAKRE
jgi:TPR repeat protein